jgi:hypothetical protein
MRFGVLIFRIMEALYHAVERRRGGLRGRWKKR